MSTARVGQREDLFVNGECGVFKSLDSVMALVNKQLNPQPPDSSSLVRAHWGVQEQRADTVHL